MLKRLFFLPIVFMLFACTTPTPQPATQSTLQHTDSTQDNAQTQTQSIATQCEWPQLLADGNFPEVLSVISGSDDGVWVEAKGYILKPIQEVIARFKMVDIVAPSHMTKNYALENFTESPSGISFDIRVLVKFILNVEFVLSWSITPFNDGDGVAYDIKAYKSSGTSYIQEITHHFILRALKENVTSIELRSTTKAAMDKEKEARQYVDELFSRLIAP